MLSTEGGGPRIFPQELGHQLTDCTVTSRVARRLDRDLPHIDLGATYHGCAAVVASIFPLPQ
jgi:hypothetical protein